MPVPQRTRQAYLLPRGTNDYGPRSQPERLPYSFELHYLLKDLGAKYEVIWMNYFGQIMMIVPCHAPIGSHSATWAWSSDRRLQRG